MNKTSAPNRERHIANRELGTIDKIDDSGNLRLRLDSGRTVAFNIKENPHFDYGYAVTSSSSQGQTADRVLIHVDTERAGEKLVNRRLAYVAVSRGRYDAQIYTNDKSHLTEQLSRDVSHRSAMEPSRESSSSAHKIEPSSARSQVNEHRQAQGHSIWNFRRRRRDVSLIAKSSPFGARTEKAAYVVKSAKRPWTIISAGMARTSWKHSEPTGRPSKKSRAANILPAAEKPTGLFSFVLKTCE